jgi:PAS domain S-box-containing protein
MGSRVPIWTSLQEKFTNSTLGYFMAALVFTGIIWLEVNQFRNTQQVSLLEEAHSETLAESIRHSEVQFERFLLAIDAAAAATTPALSDQVIADVVRAYESYFYLIEIISARTHVIHDLTKTIHPLSADLVRIETELRALRPYILNSRGQNSDYFREVLSIANSISPDVLLDTMASPENWVPAGDLTDVGDTIAPNWIFTSTRSFEVLLGVIALLIWRLSWRLNSQTVNLAQANSTLRKAIETSLDAVIITNSTGAVSSFNSAAEQMFGLPFADVDGLLIEDLLTAGSLPLEKRHLTGRQMAASLARSANRGRVSLKLRRDDGLQHTVEVAVVSDVDNKGAPIFIGFLRDITARVEADLTERDRRLEAERSSAENARFLSVMSHEMRTPLHGILTALELLEHERGDEKRRLLRQVARDCAGSALEQIEEVPELALHDVADVPDVFLTFFPVEVARIIFEQSHSLARAKHTTLTLTCDPNISEPLLGNRHAFRSALSILVGNAIKFTKHGSIAVQLYPTPGESGCMRVEVSDTGIGIEPRNLSRIFEDFETVTIPSAKTFGSSGLGLGIVHRAVALMGGKLESESISGKGSRFWFDIPLTSSLLDDAKEAGRDEPPDLGLNLLVVDDIAMHRLLLAQMLERLGHTVETADDGAVAVQAANKKRFDLILMDITMPGMNGIDATRKIREGGASADVPIIGVTANAQPHELASFKEAGFDLTLVKPITSDALVLKVQEVGRRATKTGSAYETQELTALIAKEIFDDLHAAMRTEDLLTIATQALNDTETALIDARRVPLDPLIADRIHNVAGPIAMIGAIRLHRLLCEIEDAIRAESIRPIAPRLDEAMTAKKDTDDWLKDALVTN